MGLFTSVFKREGYEVDLFETTHYLNDDISSSENRVEMLNVREFDIENDLNIHDKANMYGDFRRKVEEFNPHSLIYSVVEVCFFKH